MFVLHRQKPVGRSPRRLAWRFPLKASWCWTGLPINSWKASLYTGVITKQRWSAGSESLLDLNHPFLSACRISYCTVDKLHDKVFAYIAQNTLNGTLECHAYLCSKRKVVGSVFLFSFYFIKIPVINSQVNFATNKKCHLFFAKRYFRQRNKTKKNKNKITFSKNMLGHHFRKVTIF